METDIPWARIALGRRSEAINLWLGNSKSVTALHKDNYENVFCQVIGSKHFVLLPPIEAPCVNEQILPCATYQSHIPSANSKVSHFQYQLDTEDDLSDPCIAEAV